MIIKSIVVVVIVVIVVVIVVVVVAASRTRGSNTNSSSRWWPKQNRGRGLRGRLQDWVGGGSSEGMRVSKGWR